MSGLVTLAYGQKSFILSHQDKKGFLMISAGSSIPTGRFASCLPTDVQAGMASKGSTLNLSAGYRLLGPIGVMVRLDQQHNAIQTPALLTNLYQNGTDRWTATAEDWLITTVMAGPYLSIPMSRFALDMRLMAGQASAILPSTSISGNYGAVSVLMQTKGTHDKTLALGGGLSLRYRISPGLSLHLNGDYNQAQFTFNNLSSSAESINGRSESSRYSSSRTIGTINVSAGVALLFGSSTRPF